MIWQFFLVGVGGAIGACARFGSGMLTRYYFSDSWPLATLLVNVLGSLGIGVVFVLLERQLLHGDLRALLVVGFFGAYTTFSTVSLELFQMLERGELSQSLIYAGLTVSSCVMGAALGIIAARALT